MENSSSHEKNQKRLVRDKDAISVKKMLKMSKTKQFNDSVLLVYEQALLAENIKLDNPNEFISRINRALEKAL